MKGVILEKKGKSYTILTDKGDYVSKKLSKTYKVGEEIEASTTSFNYKYFSTVAAASIILVAILAFNMLLIPYGYAEVAINPSIELGYNRLYNVIKTEGLNEDGTKLLSKNKKIKGMKVEDAIEYLIEEADKNGYISKTEENYIVVAYTSEDGEINTEFEYKIKEKVENSGAELTLMNMQKSHYSEIRDKKDHPAVEGLKERLIKRNVPKENIEGIEEVKELAQMLKNTEKEQNKNGKPEDVGAPEHENPPGQEKEKEQNNDGKGKQGSESNSGSQGNQDNSENQGNQDNSENQGHQDNLGNPNKEGSFSKPDKGKSSNGPSSNGGN